MNYIIKQIADLVLQNNEDFERYELDARKDENGRVTIPIEINGNERSFGGITDSNGCFFYLRWRDDYIFYEDAGEDRRTGSCENFIEQRSPIRLVAIFDRPVNPYEIEAKIRTSLLKFRIERGQGIKAGRIICRQSLIDSFLVLKEESPKPKKFDKTLTFIAVDFDLSIDMSVTCDTRPTISAPADSAIYENSNATFIQNISCGSTYVAPDITVTDSDGSTFSQAANVDVVCTPSGSGPTIYNRPPVPWGRMVSGTNYDEGYNYQAGVYTLQYAQTAGQVQELDDSDLNRLTLKFLNKFSNYNRYTAEDGTQNFVNLLLDNLTGLMFRRDLVNEIWADGLTTAATTTFEGFDDWRVVAWPEINTIVSANTYPLNFSPYFTEGVKIPHTSSLRNTSSAAHLRYSVSQLSSLVSNSATVPVDLLWVRTMNENPAAFTPELLNPAFYWTAESGVFVDNAETTVPIDGQNISVIRDANHVFNQTTGSAPNWFENKINGLPAVVFSGDFLENTTLDNGFVTPDGPATIIFVMKPNSEIDSGAPWSFTDSVSNQPYFRNFRVFSSKYQFYERDLAGLDKQLLWGTPSADWQYLSMVENGTTADFYKNGVKIVNATNTDVGSNQFSRAWLGKGANTSQYFDGEIAAIFIKWDALNAAELLQLHDFIENKYNL
jgi:hypothetical protein